MNKQYHDLFWYGVRSVTDKLNLYFLHVIRIIFSPAWRFESSRQFSLFIIVSIVSISEKKSLGSREYLNFAAFSDEANLIFKMKMGLWTFGPLKIDCK